MKALFLLTLPLILNNHLLSQSNSYQVKLDSLNQKLKIDSSHVYRFKKIRPHINLDNRNSFIRNRPVNLQGFQLGFTLKERHTFGIGHYNITQKSQLKLTARELPSNTYRYIQLNYFTIFYQCVLLDKRFLEIDLPFEMGFGKYMQEVKDIRTDKTQKSTTGPIIPLGAGIQFTLKPIKWVGVSCMGGYRYVADRNINLDFNGPYYSYGIWINIRQIYRDILFYGFIKKKYLKTIKVISVKQ